MMDAFKELSGIDWWSVCLAIVVGSVAFKFLYELFEWIVKKFGIETKAIREKRENKELLKTTNELAKTTNELAKKTDELAKKTAENLGELQARHTLDEETFRNNLNNYIDESRKDRRAIHDEITKFTTNRQNDRAQSLRIQKELSDSIQVIAQKQDNRDEKIKDLTDMVVDHQISNYRWEIINLADKISNGKTVSKECLKHAISTHIKYEKIIEAHGLTNGEVDISMEIINEALKKKMSEGFEN